MDQDVERIIVWDGTGQERAGTLCRVNQALLAEENSGRIFTLPTDERAYASSALGGLALRPWGYGVRFDELRPVRSCAMALAVVQDAPFLHWAARIEPANKTKPLRGTLTLVSAPDRHLPMVGSLSALGRPVDLAQLGEPDAKGGWIVRGKLAIRTMIDGICPVALQAVADNLLVRWSAVTQSRADE